MAYHPIAPYDTSRVAADFTPIKRAKVDYHNSIIYSPEINKNIVYLKSKPVVTKMPEANMMYRANPMSNLLQPQDHGAQWRTDKLKIQDIQGTQSDAYKRLRYINGKNYMDQSDIQGAKPKILKHNIRYVKPDFHQSSDINAKSPSFMTKRNVNPLCPEYLIPSASGHKMHLQGPTSSFLKKSSDQESIFFRRSSEEQIHHLKQARHIDQFGNLLQQSESIKVFPSPLRVSPITGQLNSRQFRIQQASQKVIECDVPQPSNSSAKLKTIDQTRLNQIQSEQNLGKILQRNRTLTPIREHIPTFGRQ